MRAPHFATIDVDDDDDDDDDDDRRAVRAVEDVARARRAPRRGRDGGRRCDSATERCVMMTMAMTTLGGSAAVRFESVDRARARGCSDVSRRRTE